MSWDWLKGKMLSLGQVVDAHDDTLTLVRGDDEFRILASEALEIDLSRKTSYEWLIYGGYEFVQASPTDDGRFEIVLSKNGKTVTLLTEEPFNGA